MGVKTMSKNKGLKMLLWIGVSVLGAMVIGTTFFLAHQIQLRKNEFSQLLLNKPETTSIAVYTIGANGEIISDGNDIFLNADTPLVTASMMKLLVLTAYESAVESGVLDPNELIRVVDLERYYLPKTDGGAHINGLARLGIKTDKLGFVLDQNAEISLDEIARMMIYYSGNAETDYLIQRLGYEAVNSIPGFENHTPIHSILGISLAMMNHEKSFADGELRSQLTADVEQGNYAYFDDLVNAYLNDPVWRANQIEFMRSDQYIEAASQMGWVGQVEAAQLFPKGTAREYAKLMAQIASGNLISPEVCARIQEKLEGIPADWPLRAFFFKRFGSKDGLTAGTINLASYGVPKSGLLAGQIRIVVIMTNDVPVQVWSTQAAYQGIYFFQTDLARAKGVFDQLLIAHE